MTILYPTKALGLIFKLNVFLNGNDILSDVFVYGRLFISV